MIDQLKRILYFPVASYFRFFAGIRLKLWHPRIIVVTGSNGKTTLLHMLEAQIGSKAKYSHHANSSYGIPFDILDLHRKSLLASEWIELFFRAPINAFKNPPKEKIYVVEADVDRPYEGKFLAEFLRPEVVLWVSTSGTHSMNFDNLISTKKFDNVEEAIAYEFGYFLEFCKKLAVINGSSALQKQQIKRTQTEVKELVKEKLLNKYEVDNNGTKFVIDDNAYEFKDLLPEDVFYSIEACKDTIEYLKLSFDVKFSNFIVPPGRASIFDGIKDTKLIDSTYNANLSSNEVMLKMFAKFSVKKKWVVISDMLELGNEEKLAHEKLADIFTKMNLDKIILLGPCTANYTYLRLTSSRAKRGDLNEIASSSSTPRNDRFVETFSNLGDLKKYLHENIVGGETIFFKGSQSMFLEGVIESLLKNKSDSKKLPRRGNFWDNKRKRAGL
ncbi:hypothetical protein HZA75_06000 [Candidatus Roizmanbacteria bacterium]|nr:hypothetical protein [Candidatus Roizmanbacteria bacterium]